MAPLSLYVSYYSSVVKSFLCILFARLFTPQSPLPRQLSGQTAIVTGANSGIGLSIATALAKQGATVYLACRSLEKGEKAVQEVVSRSGQKSQGHVYCWELDTSDLNSVRAFSEKWQKDGKSIDMLVHNAGIATPPSGTVATTKSGLPLVYATNFLGSFLMTHLLEESLSESARVVFTSSTGSYSGGTILSSPKSEMSGAKPGVTSSMRQVISEAIKRVQGYLVITHSSEPAYAESKALQVLFAQLLQEHFSASSANKRKAHAFTPGFTSTPIFSKLDVSWSSCFSNPLFAMLKASEKWVAVDTDEGAKTGVWLASSGDELDGGGYWERMTRRTSIIDFMRGAMGESEFSRIVRKQWKVWESDAGVEWKAGP